MYIYVYVCILEFYVDLCISMYISVCKSMYVYLCMYAMQRNVM